MCTRLETIYKAVSTTQQVGIQKLSDATPGITDAQLPLILDNLDSWSKTDRLQFLDDLVSSDATQVGGNMSTLTLAKVHAWGIVKGAKLTNDNYRKEHTLLTNLALLRNHPTANDVLATFLGGDAGIQTLLQKNTYAPYEGSDKKRCDDTGKHYWMKSMGAYMADVGYFAANYRTIGNTTVVFNKKSRTQGGAMEVVNQLKSSDNNKMEGAAFILRVLRAEKMTNIKAFEMELTSFTKDKAFRIADLCYEKDGILKIVDGKSYLPNSFKSDFKKTGRCHDQFLDYFRNISNLNQLEFWFDSEKMPFDDKKKHEDNVAYFHTLFQELMTNAPLFPDLLSDTGISWFDAIWNNPILRNNVFPVNNTEALRKKATDEFISMIGKKDSQLLIFIKVK